MILHFCLLHPSEVHNRRARQLDGPLSFLMVNGVRVRPGLNAWAFFESGRKHMEL